MALHLSSSIPSHNYSSLQQGSLTAWSSLIRRKGRGQIQLSKNNNGNFNFLQDYYYRIAAAAAGSRNTTSSRSAAVIKCSSSSLEETEEEVVKVKVGEVTEVNKDTFWPIVKAAADKTVVLDMYTQWCGPCKIIAPKFVELSQKYLDVVFLKLDCNQENKPLAKELGIRVVPTFKILKAGSVVKEVTGAKFDDLLAAIDTVRSSS